MGPGRLEDHIAHAQRYAAALGSAQGLSVLDLGSGGGIPGLVILNDRGDLTGCLLDAMLKRTAFLSWAVSELGMADRVEVAQGRAEDLAHDSKYRCAFDVVMARSFGPPSATVEAAIGFMKPESILVISEPPGGRVWPDLESVGLSPMSSNETPVGTVVFKCTGPVSDTYPRPIRKQRSRPLF